MPMTRFHEHHGQNIRLKERGTVACRVSSFAHAICFSECPLNPEELFLVEIIKDERGWSGHLRVGLTQCDPGTRFLLPQYALPDLVSLVGRSWIYAVTQYSNHLYVDEAVPDQIEDGNSSSSGGNPDFGATASRLPDLGKRDGVITRQGQFGRLLLNAQCREATSILPTEVGSRIGLLYTSKGGRGELYLIVNGEEYGPCTRDIDCTAGPLWVVVDVYGTTKEVKIVQIPGVSSLKAQCRDVVLRLLRKPIYNVELLPLPRRIKEFLLYKSDTEE